MIKKIFLVSAFFSVFYSLGCLASDGTSTYGAGIEGFEDTYHEPTKNLTDKTTYGSLTGYYSYEKSHVFGAIDGRISNGSDNYSSPSGTSSGAPQWEFELRERVGYSLPLWSGALSPYLGLGERYFLDEGKGYFTNDGNFEYDRRILQFYLPLGVSYAYTTEDGWTFTPLIEGDLLFFGNVNSRLQNGNPYSATTYYNINNTQHQGYGVRGEFMVGKASDGFSWQFGPFIRYWNVPDSDIATAPDGSGWLEPKNNRTQIGAALRVLW